MEFADKSDCFDVGEVLVAKRPALDADDEPKFLDVLLQIRKRKGHLLLLVR